ncbi:MAG: hypothetical protein EA361_19510 [Bacteroidetes bacterium]|nr:MAG: hypothetical protein EA361_19510 [Bacteroidota bacterium]
MNYSVKINSIKTVEELLGSWTDNDLIELLKRFEYPDAGKLKPQELKEYLSMAVADFEPSEAAAILLDYKLSDTLAEGQIDNISHEMLREKVAENYSDIFIHRTLFNINQLLFKAFNGKFPNTKAVLLSFELQALGEQENEISKEVVLKALRSGLSDNNLIVRLFEDQLEGKAPFPEAEGIVWELESKPNNQYMITTSEKWLKEEDLEKLEFESTVIPYEGEGEEE